MLTDPTKKSPGVIRVLHVHAPARCCCCNPSYRIQQHRCDKRKRAEALLIVAKEASLWGSNQTALLEAGDSGFRLHSPVYSDRNIEYPLMTKTPILFPNIWLFLWLCSETKVDRTKREHTAPCLSLLFGARAAGIFGCIQMHLFLSC